MSSSAQAGSFSKDARRPPHQSHGKKRKTESSVDPRPRLEQLKPAIWDMILSDMCPSQLSILAQVSKRIQRIVVGLPIWQRISVSANLGEIKVRGRRSTFFGLVHSESFKICEICFKGCKRTTAYEGSLPVYMIEHNKHVRLCLRCRQEYYTAHPEEPSGDITREDLQRCGGYVGIEAQRERIQASREKREEKTQPERAERRSYLRSTLKRAGISQMDESDQDIGNFIRHGAGKEKWQSIAERIITRIHERGAANARHEALTNALSQHGIDVQPNSEILRRYVDHGQGQLDEIVAVIVEMQWFYRETNYQQLQHVAEECDESDGYASRRIVRHHVDTEMGKTRALHEYVRRRLISLGQWEDVSLDHDTEARPPVTLWERIRTISQAIWVEEARSRFINAGVHAYRANLFAIEPSASTMTDQLFMQLLDMGAITSIEPEAREPPPPIPFSMSLRNFIGDRHFDIFIDSNRKHLVNSIKNMYVAEVLGNLPPGISSFMARCKRDLSLTSVLYDALEREFIVNEVAAIARQQNVHPEYVIHLLKVLRQHGHMGQHIAPN
ncbi:hypothetical protein BJV82DRAFT_582860 [Fennellomyces sp. T-0311]|nr:hypothetical protein BJV82DRAFT_582860 [Fennellomyces sp. T-0311]